MIEIRRHKRHQDESDALLEGRHEHPRFSRATGLWSAVAIGGGTLLNLYGANKQRQDQAGTDAANRAAIQESDLNQWKSYLMQRGMNPSGVTQFGQIPQNAPAINTKLPLWATMPTATRGGASGKGFRGLTIART